MNYFTSGERMINAKLESEGNNQPCLIIKHIWLRSQKEKW